MGEMKYKVSLAESHPNLAAEWHPTKNDGLKPDMVTAGSNKMVWWQLIYCDKKTGTHVFEWCCKISNRTLKGYGCPQLSNKLIHKGFNDLATTHPELAKEWHPTKNGRLSPQDVFYGSSLKVWWYLPYDDPISGKHFDFEWQTTLNDRTHNHLGCPFLSGKAVWPGYNDLLSQRPDIAKEWHPTKNGDLTPNKIVVGSHKKVWWLLKYTDPKTGKTFNFEWTTSVEKRTSRNHQCPFLSGQAVYVGYNDLQTTHPNVASYWHPTKNGSLTPKDVTAGTKKIVWWLCPYDDPLTGKHFDFEWESSVRDKVRTSICPFLNGTLYKGFNDLETRYPHLAKEWNYEKNDGLLPSEVIASSNLDVWWKVTIDENEYVWKAKIMNRAIYGSCCPMISGSNLEKAVYKILNDGGMDIKKEQTFKMLNDSEKRIYRYDYHILSQNLLIECDGGQHFEQIEGLFDKNEFQRVKKADNIKNTYAFLNNMPLLRIPYTYLGKNDKTEQLITYFLETKRIPQEIIDFYSQFEFSNYVACVNEYHEKLDSQNVA